MHILPGAHLKDFIKVLSLSHSKLSPPYSINIHLTRSWLYVTDYTDV